MSITVGIDRIEGLDEVRARLGSSGKVRRHMAEVLNEATRRGTAAARIAAPKDKGLLAKAISEDDIQFTLGQEFIEATFGVHPVSRATRDARGRFTGSTAGARNYPLWVHEGTGLYGALHRVIRPKRAKAMVFVGHTGLNIRKTVRGQKPQPYMLEGYQVAQAYITAHLDDMVDGLLG